MDSHVVYRHHYVEGRHAGRTIYIGCGTARRAFDFDNRRPRWKRFVETNGMPHVEILHSGLSKDDAHKLELDEISKYEYGVLLNVNGVVRKFPLVEAKKRMDREAKKGMPRVGKREEARRRKEERKRAAEAEKKAERLAREQERFARDEAYQGPDSKLEYARIRKKLVEIRIGVGEALKLFSHVR